jgi:transposase
MDGLKAWMQAELDDKRVEPNSGLGKAYKYMLKRWDKLTLFLRKAGVPLDNNTCERTLKMAIRHRRNSLFYRSERDAEIGDMFMSLIHTAELRSENPFDYLTAVLRNEGAVAASPAEWLPWTYRATLARLGAPRAGPQAPAAHFVQPVGNA